VGPAGTRGRVGGRGSWTRCGTCKHTWTRRRQGQLGALWDLQVRPRGHRTTTVCCCPLLRSLAAASSCSISGAPSCAGAASSSTCPRQLEAAVSCQLCFQNDTYSCDSMHFSFKKFNNEVLQLRGCETRKQFSNHYVQSSTRCRMAMASLYSAMRHEAKRHVSSQFKPQAVALTAFNKDTGA